MVLRLRLRLAVVVDDDASSDWTLSRRPPCCYYHYHYHYHC